MISEAQLTALPDAEALAERAAAWILERVLMVARPVSLCLSGGSTPRALYQTLARAPYRDRMPWQRIHWFWGDERFVPSNDARSNYRMVRDALLDRIAAPVGSVHPIPTDGVTLDAAVVAYERELKQFYGAEELSPERPLYDVTLLGLGEDGHTASLLPGTPVLEERSRWVAAVAGVAPEARITLTYPALESSRDVAFLVSGVAKREILARIREGSADVPAARIRPVGRLHWFVDRAALPDAP
jgi:6-phosphogluconolactonase